MEDYKDMYPRKEQDPPDPAQDPIGAFPDNPDWGGLQMSVNPDFQKEAESPVQEEPQPSAPPPVEPPPPDTGVFYGDPNAPTGRTPDYGWQVPPVVPPEPPVTMNRRIYTMCAVIAVLIFLLCVYCIGSDVLRGALFAGEERPVVVELQTNAKPELSPEDGDEITADGEYTVRGVADLVTPSIVQVYTIKNDADGKTALGSGSGIILSEDGYIVTNAHVVQGDSFMVRFGEDDKNGMNAELIGSDVKTDLAVLKVKANNLIPAELGDSDETYVGENVLAIGNPAGLTNTVTKGIVSAIGRKIRSESTEFRMECIQTDAAISPGNSGGALVNMYGQVIGITSSRYASMYSATYEGLGFAISINEALPIIKELIENGYVTGRVRIGIVFGAMTDLAVQQAFEEKYGKPVPDELKESLWISEISENCDISSTELKPNDFILEIEGVKVTGLEDAVAALDGYQPGDVVKAHCARFENGEIQYFDITFRLEEEGADH